jgi:flagellin
MASFSVVTNIAASNAEANLYSTNLGLRTALTRVSSGLRINNSGDDAAGLAVANSYRAQVSVLNQGVRNANDGLSALQIKDGALGNISKLLDRMASLATQAASASFSGNRTTLDNEFQDVIAEINREAGVAGLSGSGGGFSVFTGDGTVGGTIGAADAAALSLSGSLANPSSAATALGAVQGAIGLLGAVQGQVGQIQNRLNYAISLAQSEAVNIKAAESRIRDANIAEESANLTRFSILNQSGLAALAQANQSTAAVLVLLR